MGEAHYQGRLSAANRLLARDCSLSDSDSNHPAIIPANGQRRRARPPVGAKVRPVGDAARIYPQTVRAAKRVAPDIAATQRIRVGRVAGQRKKRSGKTPGRQITALLGPFDDMAEDIAGARVGPIHAELPSRAPPVVVGQGHVESMNGPRGPDPPHYAALCRLGEEVSGVARVHT